MGVHNTKVLLGMYAAKGVAAVRTPSGIQFMGMRNLTPSPRKTLLEIPQGSLDAAMRWQK